MNDDNKIKTSFFITGLLYMLLIVGIKFLNNQEVTALTVMGSALFGGLLGAAIVNPQSKGWFRNMFGVAAIIFAIYTILNPVTTIGNISIIKNAELWTIVGIALILVEITTIKALQRVFHRDPKFILGPLSIFGLWLVFNKTIGPILVSYWLVFLLIMLGWLVYLYFKIGKIGPAIIKKIK